MTDKEIAAIYINGRLKGWIPDHEVLREIAGVKLSEDRCVRIVERIINTVDKMRQPLVDYLNNKGLDTT